MVAMSAQPSDPAASSHDDPMVKAIVGHCHGRYLSDTLIHGVEPEGAFMTTYFFDLLKEATKEWLKGEDCEVPNEPPSRVIYWEVALVHLCAIEIPRTARLARLFLRWLKRCCYPTKVDPFDAGYAVFNIRETFTSEQQWDRILAGDDFSSEEDWLNGWASRYYIDIDWEPPGEKSDEP